MKKQDVIKQVLNGETPDYIPFSFWSHYPDIDRDPEKIAEQTFKNFKRFNLDWIKTLNNGMYTVEDYGVTIDHEPVKTGGMSEIVNTPIQLAEDWEKLPEVTIESKALARELKYLELLLKKVNGEAPIIMTIFSPLTIAHKLSKGKVLDHIAEGNGNLVKHALDKIATTHAQLAHRAIELGADGIYFATQLADFDKTTQSIYEEYGLPFDKKVISGAEQGWLNVVHLHGSNIMTDFIGEFPVQVVNWHVGESQPDIKKGQEQAEAPVMGGLKRLDITEDNLEALENQIKDAITQLEGKNLLLSPACMIPLPFKSKNIDKIIEMKQTVEKEVLG